MMRGMETGAGQAGDGRAMPTAFRPAAVIWYTRSLMPSSGTSRILSLTYPSVSRLATSLLASQADRLAGSTWPTWPGQQRLRSGSPFSARQSRTLGWHGLFQQLPLLRQPALLPFVLLSASGEDRLHLLFDRLVFEIFEPETRG
jgi:hypothetical protein